MMVYNTGLIPSKFYEVLLARDKADFKHLLIYSSLIIIGTALVSNYEVINKTRKYVGPFNQKHFSKSALSKWQAEKVLGTRLP